MEGQLLWLCFTVGLVAIVVNGVGVLVTMFTDHRYWPPGERDWRFYLHWTLSQTFTVALPVVTYLDWNTLGLPRPATLYVGLGVFVPFYAAAVAAGFDLGMDETKGLTGDLRTGGWYRFSRNPQYVCYAVATVGFALFANSVFATVLCACYFAWWLVLPFAEEPWLREEYGEAYDRYAARVPRFVGLRSLRALTGLDDDGQAT
ncbi:methyltransferase family protein [Haloarchaeobius sp. DFWS5]|uniref:methyltransferase family protein n=1 Tax=Haloarchaeobius sp. DFWS5 TaxID=3446114 RepID=UPI003EBB2E07